MGICASCDAADEGAATARVVLPSGELREYAPPATAAVALEAAGGGEGSGSWILCDADGMAFEGPVAVAAVAPGEQLQAGQIYFVLPAEMHRRRLTRDEVAALAVRASSALLKAAAEAAAHQPSSPCRRRFRRRGAVAPLVFPVPEEDYAAADAVSPVAANPAAVAAHQKRRVAYRGGRASRFSPSPDLTAIPESE